MTKKIASLVSIILLFAFVAFLAGNIFKITGADIISVNSGGNSNITVTPDQYTEGNFFGPGIVPPAEEGGVTPPPSGGGAAGNVAMNLQVNPGQFNVNMLINTNVRETISITNIGTKSGTAVITQTNLTNMILVENTSVLLAPGETKVVGIIFIAPNATGIYNGTINIGNKRIPVSLNVLKEFILFDSNIVVLNKDYQVQRGNLLETQVTLIPMGTPVRMDVTLNYAIRNTTGTVYLTRSETLLVDSQKNIRRDFDTGSLPIGKYVVDLELVYPYGTAPSSAHFEVIENTQNVFSLVMYWVILAIVLVSILLIVLTIVRIRKEIRMKHYEPQVSSY